MTLSQEMLKEEEIEKNRVAAQTILSNEHIKKELENLITQIPKTKEELFYYPINWTLFATVFFSLFQYFYYFLCCLEQYFR